jgi:3-oxoacyl-[acyl-carrier protein] reductase
MNFEGKVVFVTGASRGIGAATALAFAKAKATLVLNASDAAHLAETVEGVRTLHAPEPVVLGYDVTDEAAMKEAFQKIFKSFGKLDVLVNNAGILETSLLGMLRRQALDRVLQVNVAAMLMHMQYASRLMLRNRCGSIVNVSSIMGRMGLAGMSAYGASKAAVIGATLSAAKELAPSGIRVNAVAPGFINTDMVHQLTPEKFKERMDSILMKRIGEPSEVAKAILFLASDEASYITGQVLGVDGGMVV